MYNVVYVGYVFILIEMIDEKWVNSGYIEIMIMLLM